jgi:hypothetical protein
MCQALLSMLIRSETELQACALMWSLQQRHTASWHGMRSQQQQHYCNNNMHVRIALCINCGSAHVHTSSILIWRNACRHVSRMGCHACATMQTQQDS